MFNFFFPLSDFHCSCFSAILTLFFIPVNLNLEPSLCSGENPSNRKLQRNQDHPSDTYHSKHPSTKKMLAFPRWKMDDGQGRKIVSKQCSLVSTFISTFIQTRFAVRDFVSFHRSKSVNPLFLQLMPYFWCLRLFLWLTLPPVVNTVSPSPRIRIPAAALHIHLSPLISTIIPLSFKTNSVKKY